MPYFFALDVDNNGVVWTSSFGAENGIRTFDGQNWTKINVADSTMVFSSLRFDNAGKLWLGSYNNGIYSLDNGVWQHYTNSWIMPGATITQILMGDNNDIWFSSENNGIIHKDSNGSWITYNFLNSDLLSDKVYDMAINNDGGLFVATYKGISILHTNGIWENITSINSRLPNDEVTSLAFDTVGNLWIGTYGGGLAVYKQNGLIVEVQKVEIKNSNDFTLFPNPNKGIFSIRIGSKKVAEVSVYNIQGKLVRTIRNTINNTEAINIDLSDVGKGVYFLHISSEGKYYSKKVIVW